MAQNSEQSKVPPQNQANGTEIKSFRAGDTIVESEPWVWSFDWNSRGQFCANCFKHSDTLNVACTGCAQFRYCDKVCQRTNWKKEHKNECALLNQIGIERQHLTLLYNLLLPHGKKSDTIQEIDLAFSSVSLMFLKIVWKLENCIEDSITAGTGKKSATKILQLFPYAPHDNKLQESSLNLLRNQFFKKLMLEVFSYTLPYPPTDDAEVIPEGLAVETLCRIQSNMRPVFDYSKDSPPEILGAGLFPGIRIHETTAVCSDHNAVEMFQGRVLRVIAIDDIPIYTGLLDARLCDLQCLVFDRTLKQRRECFKKKYGWDCTCRKCFDKFDAEVNPLKCTTTGCPERTPSDERALLPCMGCGAANGANQLKLHRFRDKNESTIQAIVTLEEESRDWAPNITTRLRLWQELIATNVLQPEAHLKFIYGWNVAMYYEYCDRYEEAWNIYKELVVCIRALHPRYHPHRARHLRHVGECPARWFRWAHHRCRSGTLRCTNVKEPLTAALPLAVECLEESLDTYTKLLGQESQIARYTRDGMEAQQFLLETIVAW